MSASASKKKRKELEQQGISPKNIAVKTASQKKKQTVRNVLVVLLVVLVCAAAVFAVVKLVNRPSYDTEAAVVTVGNETVSVPVYDYLYNYNAQNFYSSYSYFVQTGVPFADQSSVFGDGSLEDYFKQATNTTLKEILNVVADAKANHYELSDEDKTTIANGVNSIKSDAALYGYPSADKYLEVRFGEGCTLENYEEYLNLVMLYSAYAQKLSTDYKPTTEDLQKTYEEDPSAYDLVSLTYATSSAKSTTVEAPLTLPSDDNTDPTAESTPTTTYTDEAKAEAREKAESYANEMPEDAYSKTYNKSDMTNYLTAEIAEWLFDAARQPGDVKVFSRNEADIYFYTVRFDGRETNDYHLVNANIFTINKDKPAEETEQTNVEQKDAALKNEDDTDKTEQTEEKTAEQKLEELLAAIHDGMTNDEFSQAVTAQGYTVGTNSITKDYSIEEIRNFLFDENRKPGDLLTTYESATAYYIVRYVSTEEKTYRDQMVESTLWNKYYTDIASKNEVTVDEELMKHANTNLIFNASSSTGSES